MSYKASSAAVLEALPLAAAALKLRQPRYERHWEPMPHQIPPDGDWLVWMLEGGRGSGKTDGAAHYLDQHVNGPPCILGFPGGHRPAIIAPTLGDAVEACVNGPSGLKAHNPHVVCVQAAGGTFVRWPNGVEGKVFGAFTPEDVERLRAGGNRCVVWAEELAAWVRLQEAWDQMKFGLRLGPRPHVVVSTTPKPRKAYKEIRSDPRTKKTGAGTAANPHLNENVRQDLTTRYAGTRLGRQELDAELLEDTPGALWTYAMLEDRRPAPDLARCVVGVDPSGGSDPENDEQGIIVGGKGIDGHGYVVADRSCKLSPDGWGRRAVQAYIDFQADAIVCEKNFGGDMVEAVVQTSARAMGVKVKVVMVTASRGKALRAQPVAALYEQGQMHHCEVFAELEEQQCVPAGTMILTLAGERPVEEIMVGDVVWTRSGWMPVEWSGQTGVSDAFVEIEASNGSILRCTPTHPVWVEGRGFIPAVEVQAGCIIHTCQYRSPANMSSIAASSISDSGSPVDGNTTALPEEDREKVGSSMWSSTPSITAIYRPVGTSITEIGMASTTILQTCSAALGKTTSESTEDRGAPRTIRVNCAALAEKPSGVVASLAPSRVSLVEWLSSPLASEQHSAPAHVNAVTVRCGGTPEPVYNLTVSGCHEYVANGVLTHNCTWTPESGTSPDRLDALVWVVTETMLGAEKRGMVAY